MMRNRSFHWPQTEQCSFFGQSKRKVRVLHIIRTLDPAAGGPPYVAMRLAAAQAQLGHDVHLACYSNARGAECDAAYSRIPGVDWVPRYRFSPPGRWERLTARDAHKQLHSVIPTFDVIHLHEMWQPLLWASAGLAWKLRVPYVVTPHGMLDPWCLRQKRLKKRTALALGWRRLLNRAAFLHVLNTDEGRLLEPLGLTCRVETIPNGVFVEELGSATTGDFFQQSFGIPGDRTILFLGRLHYKKGLDYLAAALEILHRSAPDAHLVVAGPDEGARESFANQIHRSGLEDCVHLIGPLYGDRKYAALRSAACFCLPSRQEGFSIAVLEAMACRLPVVISEECHFPEVAEFAAGRIVPLEPAKIAAALRELLQDRAAARRMGDAGYDLVQGRYTWPKIAEQFLAAYGRSINVGGAAAIQ
jgi:glycosyltransferase involved in cell wall biosynthesis